MEDGRRTLKMDLEKATAFNRTYATMSRQIQNSKKDRDVKARLKAPNVRTCHERQGDRTGCCAPFTADELAPQIPNAQLQKLPGPDNLCNEHLKHLGPVHARRSWN